MVGCGDLVGRDVFVGAGEEEGLGEIVGCREFVGRGEAEGSGVMLGPGVTVGRDETLGAGEKLGDCESLGCKEGAKLRNPSSAKQVSTSLTPGKQSTLHSSPSIKHSDPGSSTEVRKGPASTPPSHTTLTSFSI